MSRLFMLIGVLVVISAIGCATPFAGNNATAKVTAFEQNDVFVSGTDGYHTFRIPALAITKSGALLAFCEGRKNGRGDSGAIDTVMKRSLDNGKTWGALQVVAPGGADTCGNPCPIVDRKTGKVVLLLTKNSGSINEKDICAGTAPPRSVFVTRSMDEGQTWSPLQDISAQARKDNWRWYATGPCHGIQLQDGRMIAPCDFTDEFTRHSHVIYSDDCGETWNIGGIADEKTDESTVTELFDGTLCLNMRSYRGLHQRAVSFSSDRGLTWTPAKDDPALVEPICQGSILRAGYDKAGKRDIVVFSNPASVKRDHMSIRLSMDGCKTWSASRVIWEGPAAYSDLVVTAEKRIGCLYERGDNNAYEKITMAMFPLEWITQANP